MPGALSSLTLVEQITAALAIVLVILLAIAGVRAWRRSRVTPEERERRRRAWLVATGKMGDAVIVEMHDTVLFYSYDVRGVEYTASQDVTTLTGLLPSEFKGNGISVKYDPRNPANSIVVAEQWSGLR